MDERSTAISAAEVADDRAEIAVAVKAAKAFRDKLEAAGISYHKLLALEEARRDMNDLTHHILLGVTPGFKAKTQIRAHNVHQIIEAPFEGHSKKPDETRRRIVELLGDVPRLEMFARQRADGWDAWGNEAPEA